MCTVAGVRTNIVIDEELIAEAMRLAGTTTKRATVDQALRELVKRQRRLGILDLAGSGWEGDLDEMRRDRDLG